MVSKNEPLTLARRTFSIMFQCRMYQSRRQPVIPATFSHQACTSSQVTGISPNRSKGIGVIMVLAVSRTTNGSALLYHDIRIMYIMSNLLGVLFGLLAAARRPRPASLLTIPPQSAPLKKRTSCPPPTQLSLGGPHESHYRCGIVPRPRRRN